MTLLHQISGPRRTIEVVDYDPKWPAMFEATRDRVQLLLSGMDPCIHHIGSTSVPGLCAKPKIDVDILLRSASDIEEAIGRMQATGQFQYHGDRHNDGMWTFTTGRGSYGERLYLCLPDNEVHVRRILFRDYLRRHPGAADEYGKLKRRLADEAINDWDYYTGSKGPFIDQIVAHALSEAPTGEVTHDD